MSKVKFVEENYKQGSIMTTEFDLSIAFQEYLINVHNAEFWGFDAS